MTLFLCLFTGIVSTALTLLHRMWWCEINLILLHTVTNCHSFGIERTVRKCDNREQCAAHNCGSTRSPMVTPSADTTINLGAVGTGFLRWLLLWAFSITNVCDDMLFVVCCLSEKSDLFLPYYKTLSTVFPAKHFLRKIKRNFYPAWQCA
jgi:hypothetical protein